jgi:demethylmenaquinone methyltransferase/2-methoxy-6-polyprenyl-1,4-benzoquinol methylase
MLFCFETSVPDKTPYKQGINFIVKHSSSLLVNCFLKTMKPTAIIRICCFSIWRSIKQYFKKVGFIDVVAMPQTLGVATIYVASK